MRNVIDGFEDLTREQCIDMAVRHVLRNGKASREERTGWCSYDGCGCAAAPFLTPDARARISGQWRTLVENGDVPPVNVGTIEKLQECHDTHAPKSDFIDQFRRAIAKNFPDYAIPTDVQPT